MAIPHDPIPRGAESIFQVKKNRMIRVVGK